MDVMALYEYAHPLAGRKLSIDGGMRLEQRHLLSVRHRYSIPPTTPCPPRNSTPYGAHAKNKTKTITQIHTIIMRSENAVYLIPTHLPRISAANYRRIKIPLCCK